MEAFSNLPAEMGKLLTDKRGIIDLDAPIETALKESKSVDEATKILEKGIKGDRKFCNSILY